MSKGDGTQLIKLTNFCWYNHWTMAHGWCYR